MKTVSSTQRAKLGLKQFRQEGCISYFIYDLLTRELAVVDPRADLMEDYRAFIAENALKPVFVFDTRLHWHHLSASHLFAAQYHMPIGMSARTTSARVSRKLVQDELIPVGSLELRVLETPGVSGDVLCLVGEGLAFTGDTLLIGRGAKMGFPGSNPDHLWSSLHQQFATLPGETIVLPGYDLDDVLFSTISVEKKRNPDWTAATPQELVAMKAEELASGGPDREALRRQESNALASPKSNQESHFGSVLIDASPAAGGRGVASINVEKYAHKMREHAGSSCFLDVREPEEFRNGSMPGTINIPLSELALHLEQLRAFRRIYISCQTGRRSAHAAKTLDYLGFLDVVNVSGGIKAWANAGLPITSAQT